MSAPYPPKGEEGAKFLRYSEDGLNAIFERSDGERFAVPADDRSLNERPLCADDRVTINRPKLAHEDIFCSYLPPFVAFVDQARDYLKSHKTTQPIRAADLAAQFYDAAIIYVRWNYHRSTLAAQSLMRKRNSFCPVTGHDEAKHGLSGPQPISVSSKPQRNFDRKKHPDAEAIFQIRLHSYSMPGEFPRRLFATGRKGGKDNPGLDQFQELAAHLFGRHFDTTGGNFLMNVRADGRRANGFSNFYEFWLRFIDPGLEQMPSLASLGRLRPKLLAAGIIGRRRAAKPKPIRRLTRAEEIQLENAIRLNRGDENAALQFLGPQMLARSEEYLKRKKEKEGQRPTLQEEIRRRLSAQPGGRSR